MGTIREYFKRLAAAAGTDEQSDTGSAKQKKKKRKKKPVRAGSYNPAMRRDYEKMLDEAGKI